MVSMRIAIATSSAMPGGVDDADVASALLAQGAAAADSIAWDDAEGDWRAYDRVLVRSVWDYTRRREAFLAWADSVGPGRLRNEPALLRWNSDKRYLADLADAGVPVVETSYVGPGDPDPPLAGEVVVKPTVSAGARDTGRFRPASHREALALVDRLRRSGRTAMVQPYLAAVDERGETAVVTFGGAVSHVLRKRPVLAPDREAPLSDDALGAALAMYEPDLVGPGEASPDELAVTMGVLAELERRFGSAPTVARVDLLAGDDGAPVLLELEAIEPALYLEHAPGAAGRLARAVLGEG